MTDFGPFKSREAAEEEKKEKKWMGTWPAKCDICDIPLDKQRYFVDGATVMGPWALMCPSCHVTHGQGLGTGYGQKYDSKTLLKMEG
jgi:hypothetical protein